MKYVIIVAGGSGSRMKSLLPKQFLLLNGKPILYHTIQSFQKIIPDAKIIVVLPKEFISENEYKKTLADHLNTIQFIEGGNTRFESVKNGLNAIQVENGIVFIHDGVRPFISKKMIDDCYKMAVEKGNAIPCIAIKDSLRKIKNNENKYINREEIKAIQTPQTFQIVKIKKAYNHQYKDSFTDDASVIESMGEKIYLVDGLEENIKITTPFDLEMAEIIIEKYTA